MSMALMVLMLTMTILMLTKMMLMLTKMMLMLTKTMLMLTKMMGEVGVQMARGVKAAAWNVNRRQCCAAHPSAHCTH